MTYTTITAVIIIIGKEILSGRTQDRNIQRIASDLGRIGIKIQEVRIIDDDEEIIIESINNLRNKYNYIFTTGGIGPTHDDITTAAIAKALGKKLVLHPQAEKLLTEYYGKGELNEYRLKMAYVPEGATLIPNNISIAPGFQVENIFVMAGVPKIMHAMLDEVIPRLKKGSKIISNTVTAYIAESKIAGILTDIQNKYSDLEIGSYPFMIDEETPRSGTNLVFRGTDESKIKMAVTELVNELKTMNTEYSL